MWPRKSILMMRTTTRSTRCTRADGERGCERERVREREEHACRSDKPTSRGDGDGSAGMRMWVGVGRSGGAECNAGRTRLAAREVRRGEQGR